MLEITLLNTYQSDCSLGEGLFLSDYGAAWVDINNNTIFLAGVEELFQFSIKSTPSLIIAVNQSDIQFGSDNGLCSLCKNTGIETQLLAVPHSNDVIYRSNDGGKCGKNLLLGFMHRHNVADNAGYIYQISGKSWDLIDNTIHIPNTFVEIEPSKILISDSLNGKIWLFNFDTNGNLRNKTLWAQMESGVSPDGGCLVGDYIFIAFWDDATIGVFNKTGVLLDKIPVPVIRPTNCKYDDKNAQLWVTSASVGLSESQLREYPDSGNTFVFGLRFL